MAEFLTKRQFALRLGVSRTAVNYAIKQNRVHTTMRRGKTVVNWHVEMERFIKTCRNPRTLQQVKHHLEQLHRNKEAKTTTGERLYTRKKANRFTDDNGENQSAETLLNKPLEDMTSLDAAELITVVKAKKAQLEYETAAGKLIEAEDVVQEMLDIAAKVKTAMLNIPDRVSSMLEGLDHVAIHNKLTKEINHALTNLSQRLKIIDDAEGKI